MRGSATLLVKANTRRCGQTDHHTSTEIDHSSLINFLWILTINFRFSFLVFFCNKITLGQSDFSFRKISWWLWADPSSWLMLVQLQPSTALAFQTSLLSLLASSALMSPPHETTQHCSHFTNAYFSVSNNKKKCQILATTDVVAIVKCYPLCHSIIWFQVHRRFFLLESRAGKCGRNISSFFSKSVCLVVLACSCYS